MKKHGFETCIECSDVFNCVIFLRRKVAEWIPAADNLRQIKEAGLDWWLNEQKERQALVEELLQNYNEGRSMSLYCKVCARLPLAQINKAIDDANEILADEKVARSNVKVRARVLKAVFKDQALATNISLD
ncbi:MAG: hypothetical protein JSW54_03335 [Fidelibacterota bacterium]|nr:MAG: hypothetical protein JSW54_03335 [Candidatus Neomarinimicrobiota bacterium]